MNNEVISLEDLFLDCLADMYYAEQHLVSALSKMASGARDAELKKEFESHRLQTEGHVARLERVFELFGEDVRMGRCQAIIGLIAEGEEMAARSQGQITLDAALIAAAQKCEHYEIATYGTLLEWAAELENEAAAEILKSILAEEHAANHALTELAESSCNIAALGYDHRESILGTLLL